MNGKIAVRTVVYFVLTSLLNAVLGILLVVAIHPGDPSMRTAIEQSDQSRRATIMDGLLDLGRCVRRRPEPPADQEGRAALGTGRQTACVSLGHFWFS